MTMLRILVIAVTVAIAPAAHAQTAITGHGVAVDGDTLDIGRQRIRLWGIDAPEARQTCTTAQGQPWRCGAAARSALETLIAGRPLQCRSRYLDRDGRHVAACSTGGRDLAQQLVAQGWALDYPQFSKGAFQAQEQRARRARLGVWRGSVVPPWQWRAQRSQARVGGDQAADRRCRIKGNINGRGQRIAHAPGQRDYATVRIDAARGERWFCSMAAARAAGWRPAER